MKKGFKYVMILISVLFLASCQETENMPSITNVNEIYSYIIGDEVPNYLEGVEGYDYLQNDISEFITVDDSNVDYEAVGQYIITFYLEDPVTKKNVSVTSVVDVKKDERDPIYTWSFQYGLSFKKGTELTQDALLYGVQLKENGIDISETLLVDLSSINMDQVGSYQIRYYSQEGSRYVEMEKMLLVTEKSPLTLEIKTQDVYVRLGQDAPIYHNYYVVSHKSMPNIASFVEIDDSELDLNQAGSYRVFIQVTDLWQQSQSVELIVHVTESVTSDTLDMFYLNDLHGSLTRKNDGEELGLDYIGNVILDTAKDKDVLFIAGGDILQGQLESNHFEGASIISTLNEMNLDAFIIGNHEFDWGLEKVLQYFNGINNLQANYPLLGANVFLKSNHQLPEGIEPFTIVEKNGLKVLVIGVIGYGLESSIDATMVADYYFADPVAIVKSYIDLYKHDVDMIVVANHGADDMFNQAVASYGAHVVYNGHTHQTYIRYEGSTPVMQSGSSGHYLGYIQMNPKTREIFQIKNMTSADDERLTKAHEGLSMLISYYMEQIESLYETILISGNDYSVNDLAYYIAKVMRIKTKAAVAFHNSGGTRTSLAVNEAINQATILNIFPFDNLIITVELLGEEIRSFMSGSFGKINSVDPTVSFQTGVYYKVAVHSYMFNFSSNPFMYGKNIVQTGIVLRDLLTEALMHQKQAGYTYFYLDTPIVFDAYARRKYGDKRVSMRIS